MMIDTLTLAGLISMLPLVLFVLFRGHRVCDDDPECARVPVHLRKTECCPAD